MKYKENITQVAQLQPDYLGFIFYNKSSRFFETEIPELPETIKKVGVFVNASVTSVIEKIKKHNLDVIQLHGEESPKYCSELKARTQIKIIKVFSIKNEFNFTVLKPYEDLCDFYLFDTKGKLPGGNGYTFNWNVLNNYPSTKPYFLSGGIGLSEIEKIKAFQNTKTSKYCYSIDVNSKFEIEAGLKDTNELKKFKQILNKPSKL